jgi:hypothetical protein
MLEVFCILLDVTNFKIVTTLDYYGFFLNLKCLFVLVFTPCRTVSMNDKYCLKSSYADYILFHLFEYLVCLVYYNVHVSTFSGNR